MNEELVSLEKQYSWEYINYSLYHDLKKLNHGEVLQNRVAKLIRRQERQLDLLNGISTSFGFERNSPEYYSPNSNLSDLLDELLFREENLLVEYKTMVGIHPSVNRLIRAKEKQIDQLSELQLCFPVEKEDVRQDYSLEEGYRLEKVVDRLTFPTVLTFDDKGNMYVAEAGYAYGATPGEGRILKFATNGKMTEVARGFRGPVTGLTWFEGNFFVAEGGFGKKSSLGCGKIIRLYPDGQRKAIVSGLRTCGDHFTGDIKVGPDKKLYFTVGTATNSAVVGPDNESWLKRDPKFHDTPARDYVLYGRNFASKNPLTPNEEELVETGAFKPFGVPSKEGEVIKGDLYANGVVYRCDMDGSKLQIYADGLRNPFGLGFSPFNGKLYLTDNGADDRGSRPINKDWDNLWEVKRKGWYGWPDFFSGLPATDPHFHVEGKPKPSFLIKNHPRIAGQPVVRFEPHSSSNKFSFSTNKGFGYVGEIFVGQLGAMDGKSGLKVVRVNLKTGQIRDFYVNQKGLNIQDAPKRPVGAIFNPSGDALYVVDFGNMGPREKSAGTGSVWRIVKD